MAISAATTIHTLRGPYTAKALSLLPQAVHCFTWDGQKITVGQVQVLPHPTPLPAQRVGLDDETVLYLQDDQQVIDRQTGLPVPITPGLSVMPLYLSRTSGNYPTFKQIGEPSPTAAPTDRRRTRLVSRMVYEWKSGTQLEPGQIVRFIDGNRSNCEPSNLRVETHKGMATRPVRKSRGHSGLRLLCGKLHALDAGDFGTPAKATGIPGFNHKILAHEPWEETLLYQVVGSNYAAAGIFVISDPAPAPEAR